MNFSVGDTIGQWKIIKFISGHNGAYIYEVCTILTDYDIIKKLYGKSLWAIKLKDIRFDDESQTIIKHTLFNNAYILNIPNENNLLLSKLLTPIIKNFLEFSIKISAIKCST